VLPRNSSVLKWISNMFVTNRVCGWYGAPNMTPARHEEVTAFRHQSGGIGLDFRYAVLQYGR